MAGGRDPAEVPVSLAEARPGRFAPGTDANPIVRNARGVAALGVQTLVISATTSDPAEARAAPEMVGGEIVPAL